MKKRMVALMCCAVLCMSGCGAVSVVPEGSAPVEKPVEKTVVKPKVTGKVSVNTPKEAVLFENEYCSIVFVESSKLIVVRNLTDSVLTVYSDTVRMNGHIIDGDGMSRRLEPGEEQPFNPNILTKETYQYIYDYTEDEATMRDESQYIVEGSNNFYVGMHFSDENYNVIEGANATFSFDVDDTIVRQWVY